MTARPLFIAWKADGSELLCLDQSDIISVISAKTFKVVRKHKYGSQVRRAHNVLLGSDCQLQGSDCTEKQLGDIGITTV